MQTSQHQHQHQHQQQHSCYTTANSAVVNSYPSSCIVQVQGMHLLLRLPCNSAGSKASTNIGSRQHQEQHQQASMQSCTTGPLWMQACMHA